MYTLSMDGEPYTTPEEDPFNIRPLLCEPRRKRSSMLNKWIQDQHRPSESTDSMQNASSDSSPPLQSGTRSNPYLAYPDLGTKHSSAKVSTVTLASFDLVEDDDIPAETVPDTSTTATPVSTRSKRFGTPTSLKNLHISFRANSPSLPSPASPTSARMSFLPLSSRLGSSSGRSSKQHNRSSSTSTLDTTASPSTPRTPVSPSMKWRPSVLGYFSSSQVSMDLSEALYPPPRPSMSSSHTGTSATTSITITDTEPPMTPTKIFGVKYCSKSHNSLSHTSNFAAISEGSDNASGTCRIKTDASKSSSVRLPFAPKSISSRMSNHSRSTSDALHLFDDDEDDTAPVSLPKSPRPQMAFSSSGKSGSIPRVALSALSTRNQKKKKLVVSGVAANDNRKFDGVKRWCESFGEVTHIVRMPNGELVVHFRSAEVADTVCRLRAQVFIAGVGSVNLSCQPHLLPREGSDRRNRFLTLFDGVDTNIVSIGRNSLLTTSFMDSQTQTSSLPSKLELETKSQSQSGCRCLPLVLVEGFMGRAGATIWGDFQRYLGWECNGCRRRVIFSSCVDSTGPVSSLHDRACELYYSLVGGTVDYGEEHSRIHGHARYGRTYDEGLYPEWSIDNPLHFLGHSVGGLAIITLQSLFKQGYFGSSGHPDMIRSVNTISTPFRGTQVVYVLGERPDAAPRIQPFSWGSLLSKTVHIISYMSPILPEAFDLHVESRSLSYRDSTFLNFLKHLWKSDWAESRDATPYDVTFTAAEEREMSGEGEVNPGTFYRSFATYITETRQDSTVPTPPKSLLLLTPFYLMAQAIASFDLSTLKPVPSFLRSLCDSKGSSLDVERGLPPDDPDISFETVRNNDGVVPLFSQWHPRSCSMTKCLHQKGKLKSSPRPGLCLFASATILDRTRTLAKRDRIAMFIEPYE
ncbi:hypothetical protein D9758_002331 [Tetrapyrgos nigripes]|uniref:Lipase-like C-terminal domain-containing protein n=1 Tax=Tetrapyrgos nigripes TaxID=182062 RepID=A0A8H5GP03_9AGAR|nr:hypothetical protein D9758_002331 [Tetrapyrgos nigripes]